MSQDLFTQSNFVSLSAILLRRFWLLLVAAAALGAAALYMLQLSTALHYQATAVLTLTDWQTERVTRRDPLIETNTANVGGASADEMSRALLILKDADFFQSLARSATAEQLSIEHKRRGNLVTLKWSSNSAKSAETELALVLAQWDQRWRQRFIKQRQQQLMSVQQPEPTAVQHPEQNRWQYELEFAHKAQPFAVQLLKGPAAPPDSKRPALWLVLLLGAVFGFSCVFIVLMLWRL